MRVPCEASLGCLQRRQAHSRPLPPRCSARRLFARERKGEIWVRWAAPGEERRPRLENTRRTHPASQHARRSGCSGCSLGKRSGRARADSDSCSTALPSGSGRLTFEFTRRRKRAKPAGGCRVQRRVRPLAHGYIERSMSCAARATPSVCSPAVGFSARRLRSEARAVVSCDD